MKTLKEELEEEYNNLIESSECALDKVLEFEMQLDALYEEEKLIKEEYDELDGRVQAFIEGQDNWI